MLPLTLLVASIALADSINPSTVIPALWLASAPSERRLTSYTLGVFVVYLGGGIVLVLGPGPALISALHHLRGPFEHGLEAFVGIVAVAFAVILWRSRHRAGDRPRTHRSRSRASAFALGAGIMGIELPTAFLYFGAISAILAAHRPKPVDIGLLLVYNAVFVAPLLALVLATRFLGPRTERWITLARERVRYVGQLALSGVAGAAGVALLTIGVTGLVVV